MKFEVGRKLTVLEPPHPRYVVWELTLACDQRCTHCGSRSAEARTNELSTAEALDVVRQLAELGTRELTLIGGEAYLHDGFLEVGAAIAKSGIRATMTTGGRGMTAELAVQMAKAGFQGVSVSVDGLEATHDLLRATRGGHKAALAALGHLSRAGIRVGSNTVVSQLNLGELEAIYEELRAAGICAWQVQIVAALGRAADRPEMLLQPWQILDFVPRLARLKERASADGILLMPGNNVGYYSHDELLLRSINPEDREHWSGCQAGRYVLGLESDGAVKGCPSLQTTDYVGGNVRERSIRDIWDHTPELGFTRDRKVDELWGFCRTCAFAETCMAGCTFTAQSLFGRRGNNPYCHYRAKTLAGQGLRERLVPKERAPGKPFDNGRYELVLEPLPAPGAEPPPVPSPASRLRVWQGPLSPG